MKIWNKQIQNHSRIFYLFDRICKNFFQWYNVLNNIIKKLLALMNIYRTLHFSSVQSLSHVQLFAIPWTAACQASLSITNSQSPPKPMSIELVMPSNHLILCRPLLLLPSISPSIRVFSNDTAFKNCWISIIFKHLQNIHKDYRIT